RFCQKSMSALSSPVGDGINQGIIMMSVVGESLNHSLRHIRESGKWIKIGSLIRSALSHQKVILASTFTRSLSSTHSFRWMRFARLRKWMENWFLAAMIKNQAIVEAI